MELLGVLAALLFPALSRARGRANNAVCIGNLRQLGAAVRLYSEDNSNLLPTAEILPTDPMDPQKPLPRICDVLAAYVGKAAGTNDNTVSVFRCRSDNLNYFPTEGSSYEWNAALNGKRIDQTESTHFFLGTTSAGGPTISTNWTAQFPPETTPLLLDYDEFHSRPPQSGKNVAYMDGHVAPLDASSD